VSKKTSTQIISTIKEKEIVIDNQKITSFPGIVNLIFQETKEISKTKRININQNITNTTAINLRRKTFFINF